MFWRASIYTKSTILTSTTLGISTSLLDKKPSNLQANTILSQFNTNVIGTLLVTQASEPLFRPGTKVINSSSMVASFGNTLEMPIPGVASYSISKTALSMLTVKQTLFYTGCVVVAMDPGLVRTDMNPAAPNTASDVISSMVRVFDGLTTDVSGTSVSRKGKKVVW